MMAREFYLKNPTPPGADLFKRETSLFCGGERIEGAVTLSNHRHHLRPYS